MSKTTTTTTSYTSNVIANGTTVSGNGILKNGTVVRRCLVNGTDVIHKFTRTVVKANSNLTFTIVLRYNVRSSTSCEDTWYDFDSPIYLDITVTNTAGTSSGFTSITGVDVLTQYYCGEGNLHSGDKYWYENSLYNQSFTLGQQKTLTFSYYDNKAIDAPDSPPQTEKFRVLFMSRDPDGVYRYEPEITVEPEYHSTADDGYYINQTFTGLRIVNGKVLSDNTVQEY